MPDDTQRLHPADPPSPSPRGDIDESADDAALLRCYAEARSEPAFAQLVRRHLDLVYSAALRQVSGDRALAEDITQSVFTRLARQAASAARHPALSGWLYQTTRFVAIDAVRAKQRREKYENEAAAMQTRSTDETDGEIDWARVRPIVDDLLAQLGERDRCAVLLRFFEGRSFAEVAAKLQLSEDAARMRVNRALDRVRALLARRGVASTSAALALALTNHAVAAAPVALAGAVTNAALAGAASAGGVAAGLLFTLKIMSTTKTISGIATAVALLAVSAAVYQTREKNASVDAASALQSEHDSLRAQLAAATGRAEAAAQELAARDAEIARLRASAAAQPAVETAARTQHTGTSTQYGGAMDYVLLNPETHAAYLDRHALQTKARFQRFFEAAGIAAPLQEQVLQELREVATSELDLMAALRKEGWGVGNLPRDPQARQEFQALIAEQKKFMEASAGRVRALLGDASYDQLQKYAATTPQRNVADQMVGQLYHTDQPLTPQQADQLVQILGQHRFKPQSTASPGNTLGGVTISQEALNRRIAQAMQQSGLNMLDWMAPVTDAAIAGAESILTPKQLEALRLIQAQQALEIRLAPPPAGAAATAKPAP